MPGYDNNQHKVRDSDMICCDGRALPKNHIRFRDGGVSGEEVDDGVGVGSRDGREERRGMEGAGIEEVRRFCKMYQRLALSMSSREAYPGRT